MLIASVVSGFLSAASAATTPAQPSIIVVGRAIHDKETALADCIARQCPPNEDIDASLALAEAQLLDGKYREARGTLLKALSRNKREAEAYPIPVSDLYRANGRVAAHLGYDEDYYRSTWGIYNTLKKGLPASKDLQYSAMMEVAEMMATTRGHDRAREYYRSIARHAKDEGRPDIAALAELRMILRHYPAYARENAIRKIATDADPSTKAAQLEARLALARIAYERQDIGKGDAIVREFAAFDIKRPILVYAPRWEIERGVTNTDSSPTMEDRRTMRTWDGGSAPVLNLGTGTTSDSTGRDTLGTGSNLSNGDTRILGMGGARFDRFVSPIGQLPTGPQSFSTYRMPLHVEDMWIDVGFRITFEGKVSDLQVLRSHGDVGWSKPLLVSIAGRRYTPANPASLTSYRAERYTYTSGLEAGTASRKAQHSPNARVEYLDLSDIGAPN